jgi:hypothetical protein
MSRFSSAVTFVMAEVLKMAEVGLEVISDVGFT